MTVVDELTGEVLSEPMLQPVVSTGRSHRTRHPEDPKVFVGGRGGNRLPKEHPSRRWTPQERRRRLDGSSPWRPPEDPERRDHKQRTRLLRGWALGVERGQLRSSDLTYLDRMLDSFGEFPCERRCGRCKECREHLTVSKPIWPSQPTIVRKVNGPQNYDGPKAGARTAREHLRRLEEGGWLLKQQRATPRAGDFEYRTNLYWFTLPDDIRLELELADDVAGAEKAKQTKAAQSGRGRTTGPAKRKDEPQPTRLIERAQQEHEERQAEYQRERLAAHEVDARVEAIRSGLRTRDVAPDVETGEQRERPPPLAT